MRPTPTTWQTLRLVCATILLSLLAVGSWTAAQNTDGYVSASFFDGVPEFGPLDHLELRDLRHAEIRLGLAKHVFLIWGKNGAGKDVFRLTEFDREGGSVSSDPVKKSKDGTYTGKIAPGTLESLPPNESIDIRLNLDRNVMLYRLNQNVEGPSLMSGRSLPDFEVRFLDGSSGKVSDFRGRTLVINYWATSCSPCIEEMPGLNTLVEKYSEAPVVFLAVAWNRPQEVEAFLKSRSFTYKQTTHTEGAVRVLGNSFPRNVIVDPEGRVVYDHTGGSPNTYRSLDPVIQRTVVR